MNRSLLGYLAAFLTAVVWGVPSVFGKSVVALISFETLVLIQYTLATLTVGLFILFRSWQARQSGAVYELRPRSRMDLLSLAIGGILGQYSFSALSFLSLKSISAPENGIIQALIPILILGIGALFYKEHFTKSQILATFFAFLGVSLLIFGGDFQMARLNQGHLICFAGIVFFAVCAHDRERLTIIYGPAVTMFYQFAFSLLAALVFHVLSKVSIAELSLLLSHPRELWMAFGIGVGISGCSYLLYAYSVQSIGASHSGIFLNIVPISSFLLSRIILDEELTQWKVLGISIVTLSMLAFKFLGRHSHHEKSSNITLKEASYAG